MPDTKYASEIEMISEQSSDNDQFSLIAKFDYICSGKVTNINSFSIHEDLDTSSDLGSISIDSSSMHFSFDQDAQEMLVYVPVKILPLDVLPSEYPDSMEFGFYAKPTYSVDSVGVPIDNSQIFFKAQINIERPHDHTMWLTPETISDSIKFLNDSIDFTKKTVDWTGYASVGGLLACTGAKFWYNFQVGLLNADDKDESNPSSKINELKERLYLICDRVACTESPKVCGTFDDKKFFDVGGKKSLEEAELVSASIVNKNSEDKDILASFTSLNIGSECTYSNGQSGALVTSHLKTYERDETPSFWKPTKETEVFVRNKCVPANFGCFNSNGVSGEFEKDGNCAKGFSRKVSGVDLQELSGVCFQAGAPKFDNTRCNFFGADSLGVPNKNPKDNIIESVRCGCLTSTYSHLKKFLEIQTQLKMCLEQARVGDVEGSYCERLLSTAICDVGTNIMFKTIFSSSSRDDGTGEDNRGAISKFFSNMGRGDALLDKRYEGTFYSQAGLNSESVFHKVCLASLTGDWSVLTDNILTSIDENEVEPSFGPLFPSSRIIGYDPITGKMRVKYFFTYAGVSGGQRVKSRVRFICNGQDKQTGKYCPKGVHYASDLGEGELFTKNLYIEEDGSAQETIVIVDDDARFIYNEIEIEHEFEVDGKSESETFSEGINHKFNSLIGSCYWGTGIMGDNLVEGIHCDKMFSEESLVSMFSIDKQMTRLVPKRAVESLAVFYPGHKVLLDLFYFRQGTGSQDKFRVHYLAKCPSKDNEPVYGMSSDVISADPKVVKDHELVEIFNVPQFGISSVEGFEVVRIEDLSVNDKMLVEGIVLRKTVDSDSIFEKEDGMIFIRVDSGEKRYVLDHEFRVTGIIVNGKEISLDNKDLIFSSLPFEFNSVSKFVSFKLEFGDDFLSKVNGALNKESEENSILLKFDRSVKDVKFYLKLSDDSTKLFSSSSSEEGVSTNSKFNGLKPGICSLKVRILPEQVTGIGVDNFESFSPVSSNFTNVDFNDMFSTSFRVLKEPNTGEFFSYEVLDPFFNQMICLKDGKGFEVRTAFLDFGEFKKEEYKFVVSFSSDEFLISSDKKEFGLDESIFIEFDNLDLPQKVSKFKVNMFVDLVKLIENTNKVEVVETQKQEFYLGDCSALTGFLDKPLDLVKPENQNPANNGGSIVEPPEFKE